MKTYPYDPRGTNTENHFTEERIIESDNSNDRVVVLDHSPFFDGLVVRQPGSSNPLTRGVDYELEYALTALDDSVTTPVFCGVHLINPTIKGLVSFEGQMLGGTFYDAFVEILDELIKYINNPTSADFLLLANRPSLYPATPAATSWADMLNKKYLASAVHDVEVDAGAANDLIRDKLTALKAEVQGLANEIVTFNFPAHTAAKNPHSTTVAQNGAHPVSLKTPDTFLAYGKKLRQLTSEIRALGLQQADIDKYISKWVSKDAKGVFNATISGTRALFRSPGGESEIVFSTDAFTLKSNGSIILAAGYVSGDSTVRFMEWKAGTNTLRIESTGSALGMDKLTLNGVTLLTTTALMEYQQDPNDGGGTSDPDDTKVYIEGRNGINFTGKGSKVDPVTGTVTPQNATTTVKGVVKLKKGPGTETSGVAATPDSLTGYEADMGGYVLKSTLLNNKAMDDGSRTLTKTDLGLGNANNIPDADKPLSDDLSEALTDLSPTGHHHDWSELNIYEASQQLQGIGRYSKNQAGLAAGRGVTPSVLKALSDRLAVVAAALANAKSGTVTDFTAVNASTWTLNTYRMSVTDLKYFYLQDGTRKEGVVSGSIDLQTTPMFNWFSPDNQMEDTWGTGVINTGAGLTFTGMTEQPPIAIQGKQIGKSATGMGNLSVVSVLAKMRLKSATGAFKMYIAGGGKITVYLNGEQVATGNSPLYVVAEPPLGVEEHCIAIKAECNDPAKAAALQFDIYDDIYPLYTSGTETRLEHLQEFVTKPGGLRHYLYVNMLTTSLYSRAEPILSQDLDIERGLIGYVDLPNSPGAASTLTFNTTFDFGPSDEISDHIAIRKAHGSKASDWAFSDNPRFKMLGKVQPEPYNHAITKNNSNNTFSNMYFGTRGMIDWYHTGNGSSDILAWFETLGNHPMCWFTPFNPKENNAPTFEGTLTIDVANTAAAVAHAEEPYLVLIAAKNAMPGSSKVLRISLKDFKCHYGYLSRTTQEANDVRNSGNIPVIGLTEVTRGITVTKLSDTTIATGDCLDYVDLGTNAPFTGTYSPRWAVRYRYNVTTGILRMSVLCGQPGFTGVREQQVEIKLPFDLLSYFLGDGVGVLFNGLAPSERLRVGHALMNPNVPAIDLDKYQFLRPLFEAYVDTNIERRTDNTRDSEYVLKVVDPTTYGEPVNWELTEWVSVPCGQGNAEISHRGQLGLPFHASRAERGSLLYPAGKLPVNWTVAKATAAGKTPMRFREPVMLCWRPDKATAKAIAKITGNITGPVMAGGIILGSRIVDGGSGRSWAAQSGSPSAAVDATVICAGQAVYLWFKPADTVNGESLNLSFSLNVLDSSGATITTLTPDSAWELRSASPQYVAEKRNPFHLTSTAWLWVLSELKREQTAAGNALGEWSS
ncbi:hypothetical protein STRATTON_188 [Erwinia phage vB_EamM_Stratton]|uniref:Virion structural protein n=1 Tax=Erwinia phage vB_EamM_Stratton TaxID=1883378 RepID=A0A1B2IHA7_9CAUD|nr:hypothetical protein STRATTON_188 [Erwinia phage vB_EamM_Stratton]